MKNIILFVGLFTAGIPARAEIMCGITLEWLADTCPYVGTYSARTVSRDADYHQLRVSATLVESLRGKPPQEFSFDYPTFDAAVKSGRTASIGNKFLIFLQDADTQPKEVRWEHIISLTDPATRGYAHVALRPDFTLLTDGDQILQVVRERIAKHAVTPTLWREYPSDRIRLEIPSDTPAYRAIFSGSSCYLIVPDDLLNIGKEHEKK